MTDMIETEFTDDEMLLLMFQKAKVDYERSASVENGDPDCEFERAYHQAVLGLDNLKDPVLRELAREAQGPGKRAYEAEQKLLELSLRIKNLFPLTSHHIN
jgi:hypothetical protein